MNKEFIPYKQALALKELGFDELCLGYYYTLDNKIWHFAVEKEMSYINDLYDVGNSFILSTPLYQQAFRWFREKYQLHSTITSISQESWQWHITKPGESLSKLYDEDFYTYEETENACLNKLIEIVKKQNNV